MMQKKNPRIYWDTDMPLRTTKGPVNDQYKFKQRNRTTEFVLPAHSGNTLKNTPIPDQKMNNFDFTFGFFGPPDQPVPAGIVDVPKTAKVSGRYFYKNKVSRGYPPTRSGMRRGNSFYDGPQQMIEIFIDTPMVLATDLPCSVSGFKY